MKTTTSFLKTATVIAGVATLFVGLASESLACHKAPNPVAFQHPIAKESALLPNGMIAIVYKYEGKERVVHVTVHRIHMTLQGAHPRLPERRDPQYMVLQTDGTLNPMTYVVKTNALFYGTGRDAMGFPLRTWIDPKEDGLNGNEHPTYPNK